MSLLVVSRPEGWVANAERQQRMDSGWRRRLQKEELRSGLLREMRTSMVGVARAAAAAGPGYRAERHLGHSRRLAWDLEVVDCS